MIDESLLLKYKKALEQKYNAVCFDIDGTLTENNSKKIDKRVIPVLANILKRHVQIVFITGRGETGLRDLVNEIIGDLREKYNITNSQLQKMYALTNDGARIFMTSENSEEIFNINEYITPNEDFESLRKIDLKIRELINNFELKKYCRLTYSEDSKTKKIINVRLALLTENKDISNHIIDKINQIIEEEDNKSINLTIGIHNGDTILQIGTSKKDIAIEITERIIGIPKDSMLRIGDCGDKNGNDYSMLNCSQGFSVDKISGEENKCFPIVNDNNEILKGVDATLYLINKAKILPTICLEHATENEYRKKYSLIEKKMNLGKNKRISYFNDCINDKFELVDGIYGLYDKSSGSITIPMYEWIMISDENPLKKFWSKSTSTSLNYAMYDNDSILLRGSKVYYYFLSHREHDEKTGIDLTTKEMVYEWLENFDEFCCDAIKAIEKTEDINELNNCKMILGIIDNIRNQLLILLNYQIIQKKSEKIY